MIAAPEKVPFAPATNYYEGLVTCTSVEDLQDAPVNPDKHRDLIVRVGGYSDYFVNLTPTLQKAVVERNVHELG